MRLPLPGWQLWAGMDVWELGKIVILVQVDGTLTTVLLTQDAVKHSSRPAWLRSQALQEHPYSCSASMRTCGHIQLPGFHSRLPTGKSLVWSG